MPLPKKIKKNIPLTESKILLERRKELVEKIKQEYEMLNPLLKQAADQALEYNDIELMNNTVGISHKKMLELVRADVRDD
jgi:hypothetical protein